MIVLPCAGVHWTPVTMRLERYARVLHRCYGCRKSCALGGALGRGLQSLLDVLSRSRANPPLAEYPQVDALRVRLGDVLPVRHALPLARRPRSPRRRCAGEIARRLVMADDIRGVAERGRGPRGAPAGVDTRGAARGRDDLVDTLRSKWTGQARREHNAKQARTSRQAR